MVIAFTICSNNYLAQAKTLGDSFLAHHPDAQFIIGLVDRFDKSFDYNFFSSFEIIPVEDIHIDNLNELAAKYNIVELNTAVKPSYIHYIFQKYPADKLIYLDPDILVTAHFEELLNSLNTHNIVLTPHICTPIDDDYEPTDYHTLRGGVFNLGFIALSNYTAVTPFLNWWHDRVVKYGYADFAKTMFYDQLWLNYVPVMFDNYYILKHPGYNMAVWNLHERWLKSEGEDYIINDQYPLRFFHFSSYRYTAPEKICNYHVARYNLANRPDLQKIYAVYRGLLIKNKIEIIAALKFFFNNKKPVKPVKTDFISKVITRLRLTAKVFLKGGLH